MIEKNAFQSDFNATQISLEPFHLVSNVLIGLLVSEQKPELSIIWNFQSGPLCLAAQYIPIMPYSSH